MENYIPPRTEGESPLVWTMLQPQPAATWLAIYAWGVLLVNTVPRMDGTPDNAIARIILLSQAMWHKRKASNCFTQLVKLTIYHVTFVNYKHWHSQATSLLWIPPKIPWSPQQPGENGRTWEGFNQTLTSGHPWKGTIPPRWKVVLPSCRLCYTLLQQ